jgi:hypothetical protein
VRESRSLGSVRGDRGNPVPYREHAEVSKLQSGTRPRLPMTMQVAPLRYIPVQ